MIHEKNKKYTMVNADNNLIDRWSVDWPAFNNSVKSLLCFDLMNDIQLQAEHTEIQSLLSQIDYSKFIGWNKWWLTQLCKHYPVGKTKHLLEDGHKATAEYILTNDPY